MDDFECELERHFCNQSIYVHLSLYKCERRAYPTGYINAGGIHLQLFFPLFTDKDKHIDWVKAAWGLGGTEIKPETPQLEATEEEEYDPIPF